MDNFNLYVAPNSNNTKASVIATKLNIKIIEYKGQEIDNLSLLLDDDGLKLVNGPLSLKGDFSTLEKRLKPNNLNGETIIKAARFKNKKENLTAIDATAGLGEDSFLLAAYGFNVKLYEKNPIIALLLEDALERATNNANISEIASRMELFNKDSIEALNSLSTPIDLILLDPMFPERSKSGLIKKKFQLLQQLEMPCDNEEELLQAALNAKPQKIIIKRPAKAPSLAGKKPNYSINGESIRYDCIIKGE